MGIYSTFSPAVSSNPRQMFMFCTAAPQFVIPSGCRFTGENGRHSPAPCGRRRRRPFGYSTFSPAVSSNPSAMFMFCTAAPQFVIPSGCRFTGEDGRHSPAPCGRRRRRPFGYSTFSPAVSSNPSAMFMFCTAAPDAPLPKLSKRAVTRIWSSLPVTSIFSVSFPAMVEA